MHVQMELFVQAVQLVISLQHVELVIKVTIHP